MTHLSWSEIHADSITLAMSIDVEFDILIALQRGGTVPCTIISHYLDRPMISIGVKSYDHDKQTGMIIQYQSVFDTRHIGKRALFVDDLSDTGETLDYVKQEYQNFFKEMSTATLYTKDSTKHIPTFSVRQYAANDWLVFPWEKQ